VSTRTLRVGWVSVADHRHPPEDRTKMTLDDVMPTGLVYLSVNDGTSTTRIELTLDDAAVLHEMLTVAAESAHATRAG